MISNNRKGLLRELQRGDTVGVVFLGEPVCVYVCANKSVGVKSKALSPHWPELSVLPRVCVCVCVSTHRSVISAVTPVGVYTTRRTLHTPAVCARLREELSAFRIIC